jgi:putative membrane protein
MKGFFYRLVITALGLWAAATIVPGITIAGWRALIISALLLGIVNAIVRPLLLILTLPITILTLGLFIFIVNGLSLAIVAALVPGLHVAGIWAATLGALVVGLTSWFASAFVSGSGRIARFRRVEVHDRRLDG